MKIELITSDLVRKINKLRNCSKFGIKLFTEENKLYAYSSNGEMSGRAFITQVDQEVNRVVPERFLNIIKSLQSSSISLVFDEKNLKINAGKYKGNVNYIEDRILNVSFEISNLLEIQVNNIYDLIKRASIAASKDKLNLSGLNLDKRENLLIFESCDGFRVSQFKLEEFFAPEKVKFRLLNSEVERAMSCIDRTKMRLRVNSATTYIADDEAEFLIRNLDYNYPDLDKFIPKNTSQYVVLNKDELVAALDRISIISDQAFDSVNLRFQNNELVLWKRTQLGEAAEKIELKNCNFEETEIIISINFLKDALKTFDSKKITIHFNEAIKPILIKSMDEPENTQMILPIRPIERGDFNWKEKI